MRVKICGITRLEDALAAVEAGADSVGFVFVRSSKRFIEPGSAREIIRQIPPFVSAVGVVADSPREEILEFIRAAGVTAVQFHGEEKPEDLQGYPVPVYKAFRVREGFRPELLGNYPGPAYLLDTAVAGALGGTGRTFDWSVAEEAKKYGRIILAGGITPENVGAAIRSARPFAIDVSSGVESSAGVKDHQKIFSLFRALRAVED